MVEKEILEQNNFIISNQIVCPIRLKRGNNGYWSIELVLNMDFELEDKRKISTGNRIINIGARQIGRKLKKEVNSEKEINSKKAYE